MANNLHLMPDRQFGPGTIIDAEWLNQVNRLVNNLLSATPGLGANPLPLTGLADLFQSSTVGALVREFGTREQVAGSSVLKYIPQELWAGLAAGTETSDMGGYIDLALKDAARTGGLVLLPPWTLCHSTPIRWSSRALALIGTRVKEGVTASSARGTSLKWTGVTGVAAPQQWVAQVVVAHGGHNALISNIHFDANDRADGCIHLKTETRPQQPIEQIHRPEVGDCAVVGYRGTAVVIGDVDTAILGQGQFEQAILRNCKWWGAEVLTTRTERRGRPAQRSEL